MRRLVAAVALLIGMTTTVGLAAPARATASTNGLIAFTQADADGVGQIWSCAPGRSGPVQVTSGQQCGFTGCEAGRPRGHPTDRESTSTRAAAR